MRKSSVVWVSRKLQGVVIADCLRTVVKPGGKIGGWGLEQTIWCKWCASIGAFTVGGPV